MASLPFPHLFLLHFTSLCRCSMYIITQQGILVIKFCLSEAQRGGSSWCHIEYLRWFDFPVWIYSRALFGGIKAVTIQWLAYCIMILCNISSTLSVKYHQILFVYLIIFPPNFEYDMDRYILAGETSADICWITQDICIVV